MARQPVPAQHNHTYYAHNPGAGRALDRELAMPDPIVTTGSAAPPHYEDVDVAIVAESTYPYLKGGVSAVVHDIVRATRT